MRIHKHIAIRRSSGAGVLEKWDLKRTIEPPGPDDGQSGRQREILPLPLWADGKEELRNLFGTGDFRKFGGAEKKAFRHARRAGLLIWHSLCGAPQLLVDWWWQSGKSPPRSSDGESRACPGSNLGNGEGFR